MEGKTQTIKLPEKFYWGAATSAHQVEGNNHNDWTEWEIENAKIKMQNAKLRSWPDFILKNYPNPLQEENYISGRACDHYNRFREDFEIAKSLGHNAHRFSLEWSRIEPEEGKFNEKEIEHYREVIKALRERGMEPFVTLWHLTLPLWFSKKGGWEKKENIKHFVRYCEYAASQFKYEARFFITMNEPSMWSGQAYLAGIWPPQKRNIILTARVFFNLIRAHKLAYNKIKAVNPEAVVGLSENLEWQEAAFTRFLIFYFRNLFFLDRVRHHLDFIGMNYYKAVRLFPPPWWGRLGGGDSFLTPPLPSPSTPLEIALLTGSRGGKVRKTAVAQQKGGNLSDIGWRIYPEGLYKLLVKVWNRYKIPIFITENGLADAKDEKRAEFIRSHVFWLNEAVHAGVDVRGYFHFSLLDNFEWDKGFWPRFGLIEVDFKTMERKVRESAKIYAEIIKDDT